METNLVRSSCRWDGTAVMLHLQQQQMPCDPSWEEKGVFGTREVYHCIQHRTEKMTKPAFYLRHRLKAECLPPLPPQAHRRRKDSYLYCSLRLFMPPWEHWEFEKIRVVHLIQHSPRTYHLQRTPHCKPLPTPTVDSIAQNPRRTTMFYCTKHTKGAHRKKSGN